MNHRGVCLFNSKKLLLIVLLLLVLIFAFTLVACEIFSGESDVELYADSKNVTIYASSSSIMDDIKDALEIQKRYEPFGEGHAYPVYKIINAEPARTRDGWFSILRQNTVKITTENASAISFDPKIYHKVKVQKEAPLVLNLFGTLSENKRQGKLTPQIEMIDLEVS